VSKGLVHKVHHRRLEEGDAAFEPRSRRPRSSPNRTPTVTTHDGNILGEFTLDPTRDYQRKNG
jgi:hypothetical protein